MATETLRPDAAGDECAADMNEGETNCPNHYQSVYEVVADGDTTIVGTNESDYLTDLYNIANHSVGSGTINHVTVYAVARNGNDPSGTATLKIAIKSDATVTEDTAKVLTNSYATYSKQWATNPADSGAWSWADIDALQVGFTMRRVGIGNRTYVTQVYVVVDFTAVVAGGRSFGSIIG